MGLGSGLVGSIGVIGSGLVGVHRVRGYPYENACVFSRVVLCHVRVFHDRLSHTNVKDEVHDRLSHTNIKDWVYTSECAVRCMYALCVR
jgi:hypothetical protein